MADKQDPRQGGAPTDVEITPQMIKAGVLELRERYFGEELSVIVRDVYRMMTLAR